MEKKIKKVTTSHRELLDVIQIIHIIRKVNTDRNEMDEVLLMDSLIYTLLDSLENTESQCTVKLENEQRFAIWLCIDTYRQFLESTSTVDELPHVKNLMTIFGGE